MYLLVVGDSGSGKSKSRTIVMRALQLLTKKLDEVKDDSVHLANAESQDGLADNTELRQLNEATLLHNMRVADSSMAEDSRADGGGAKITVHVPREASASMPPPAAKALVARVRRPDAESPLLSRGGGAPSAARRPEDSARRLGEVRTAFGELRTALGELRTALRHRWTLLATRLLMGGLFS